MISVIILVKNADDKIEDCLESVKNLASEIVVLDTGSTDKTLSIAKKYGARVGYAKSKDYAGWRNEAARLAREKWLFYIDHDERVSKELAREVIEAVKSNEFFAYDIPRKNYVFGKWLKHGGWWPDRVLRLIKKENLISWEGEVHEQPKFKGKMGSLNNPLTHLKENNLSDMVEKTNRYSVFEARLLFEANHPSMHWWRFVSIVLREVWYRLIVKGGVLDGPEGIIYCLYQGYSRFVTYARLWEMQIKTQKSKFMKRAAIYDPYLDTGGGGERYILTVAVALKKIGWSVDLYWKGSPKILAWLEERLGLDLEGINLLEDINRGSGYDLAFWLSDGSVPFLFAKKNIIHFQTPFTNVGGKSLLNRLKFLKIDKIICNSNFTKGFIDSEYGISSSVVYPPVSVVSKKEQKKENIILSVGRYSQLQQAKRQDVLVESFKDLCLNGLKDWRLVLIGGSDVGGEEFVKKLKAASDGFPINVLENLPFKTVEEYFAKAKIFWSASGFGADEEREPSKVEHFGITVVEAMASGCIPLVTNKGGHKEIITNGENGFLWEKVTELKEITFGLINDERRRKKIAQGGPVRAADFSQIKFEKNILQILA